MERETKNYWVLYGSDDFGYVYKCPECGCLAHTSVEHFPPSHCPNCDRELFPLSHKIDKEDVVNEPSHYKQGTFETIDEMLIVFGPEKTYNYCVINAWKYRARALYKGNTKQDIAKSDRYLKMARDIACANGFNCCLIKEESHGIDR